MNLKEHELPHYLLHYHSTPPNQQNNLIHFDLDMWESRMCEKTNIRICQTMLIKFTELSLPTLSEILQDILRFLGCNLHRGTQNIRCSSSKAQCLTINT